MGFFKVNKTKEAVKEDSGSNSKYIFKSGMYDVTIAAAWVEANDKGARTVNLLIDYNNQLQPIFQAFRLDNNDGTPNYQADLFNKLCIILGIEEIDEPVETELPIGKGGALKPVDVLEEFEDQPITLRISMEYSKWNGKIQERKVIKNVYRQEDKATAPEIINDAEFGKQYEKDLEYADKPIYKDDLTPEDIEAWRQSFSKKDSKPKAEVKAPKFGKKKFGTK
jgi:hypothetical protein